MLYKVNITNIPFLEKDALLNLFRQSKKVLFLFWYEQIVQKNKKKPFISYKV